MKHDVFKGASLRLSKYAYPVSGLRDIENTLYKDSTCDNKPTLQFLNPVSQEVPVSYVLEKLGHNRNDIVDAIDRGVFDDSVLKTLDSCYNKPTGEPNVFNSCYIFKTKLEVVGTTVGILFNMDTGLYAIFIATNRINFSRILGGSMIVYMGDLYDLNRNFPERLKTDLLTVVGDLELTEGRFIKMLIELSDRKLLYPDKVIKMSLEARVNEEGNPVYVGLREGFPSFINFKSTGPVDGFFGGAEKARFEKSLKVFGCNCSETYEIMNKISAHDDNNPNGLFELSENFYYIFTKAPTLSLQVTSYRKVALTVGRRGIYEPLLYFVPENKTMTVTGVSEHCPPLIIQTPDGFKDRFSDIFGKFFGKK